MARRITCKASLFAAVMLAAALIPGTCAYAAWLPNGNPIATTTGAEWRSAIASDGAGGAIIAWDCYRDGTNYDVFAQRIDASGNVQWAVNGIVISAAPNVQTYPAIVPDGAGGAIITWNDRRTGAWDIYAQRVNASGTVLWTANGISLCTASGEQAYPAIVSDGAGGAIVAWQDKRSATSYDVYGQRVNGAGAVQWAANGIALCAATGDQQNPTIAPDGAGGALAVWWDLRSATDYDVYAQKVDASGTVQWTADGVALCAAALDQTNPAIVSDGAGGAIATWTDYRNGSEYNIYAQRVNAAGVVQWAANGVGICTASGDQQNSTIASDGAGGAILAWHDNRSGNYNIYTQRMNASGVAQWPANGIVICTASGDQLYPVIIPAGSGKAIVTWQDYRSGASDIYSQRVDGSGSVEWSYNGVAVCTEIDIQEIPQMTSDGADGAIIEWRDFRNRSNWDVYAAHVRNESATDAPCAGIAAAALRQNHPNPFNPATFIAFSLRTRGEVTLRVYDAAGRPVRTLVDGVWEPGEYRVMWDGARDGGAEAASGVYFYRLETGGLTETRKMVLLK